MDGVLMVDCVGAQGELRNSESVIIFADVLNLDCFVGDWVVKPRLQRD